MDPADYVPGLGRLSPAHRSRRLRIRRALGASLHTAGHGRPRSLELGPTASRCPTKCTPVARFLHHRRLCCLSRCGLDTPRGGGGPGGGLEVLRRRSGYASANHASDLGFCTLEPENVPGFREIRSKPLPAQASDLGVCNSRMSHEGGGCADCCANYGEAPQFGVLRLARRRWEGLGARSEADFGAAAARWLWWAALVPAVWGCQPVMRLRPTGLWASLLGPSRIRGIEGCWHRLGSLCHEDAAGFEVAWLVKPWALRRRTCRRLMLLCFVNSGSQRGVVGSVLRGWSCG